MAGKEEKSVSFSDPLILLGGFLVIGMYLFGAWYFGHEYISMAYTYIRRLEWLPLYGISSTFENSKALGSIARWINEYCIPGEGIPGGLICTNKFADMRWRVLEDSSFYMNIALMIFLIYRVVRLFMTADANDPNFNFTKVHNVHTFMKEQKKEYPHLGMFSSINLIDARLTDPVFGMSLTSKQFMVQHELVTKWTQLRDKSWSPEIDRKKASDLFVAQLGQPWNEQTWTTSLSTAELMVFACVIPRVAATDIEMDEDKYQEALKESDKMVEWCWKQFKPPSPEKKKKQEAEQKKAAKKQAKLAKKGVAVSNVATKPAPDENAWLHPESIDRDVPIEIIKKYLKHKEVQALFAVNAYPRTLLFSFFEQARRLGVFQPASFRWLRFYERSLWYVIDSIGRKACFAESAGVMSHWLFERALGNAVYQPQVSAAVEAFVSAAQSYKYPKPLQKQPPQNTKNSSEDKPS